MEWETRQSTASFVSASPHSLLCLLPSRPVLKLSRLCASCKSKECPKQAVDQPLFVYSFRRSYHLKLGPDIVIARLSVSSSMFQGFHCQIDLRHMKDFVCNKFLRHIVSGTRHKACRCQERNRPLNKRLAVICSRHSIRSLKIIIIFLIEIKQITLPIYYSLLLS